MPAILPSLLSNNPATASSFAPRYQGDPLPREGVEAALHATTLPPLLGDWRVDHYERGRPVMVPNDENLLKRYAGILLLATVYAALAKHTWHEPLWEAALPAWAGVLAFTEGRKADDKLGQLQNTLQAVVPILVGGYAGVPLANVVRHKLQQGENATLFKLMQHPYHQQLAEQLVMQDEAELHEQIAQLKAQAKTHAAQSDTGLEHRLTLLELQEELRQRQQENKAFLATLAKTTQTLTQDNLHLLPSYRTELNRLQVALVSDVLPNLSATQQATLKETLKEVGTYLERYHPDDRVTAEYFNLPQAVALGQKLHTAHTLLQQPDLPPALKQQADATLEPLHRLFATETPVVRHWFSPLRLAQRIDELEGLKTSLHDHFQRFSRPTVERTLATLEQADFIRQLPLSEWQKNSTELANQFKAMVQHLKTTQYPANVAIKTLGPPLGMVLAGSLLGNLVARHANQWLGVTLPGMAAAATDHVANSKDDAAKRLNASYAKAIHQAVPSLDMIPLEPLTPSYHYSNVPVSWNLIEDTAKPVDYRPVTQSGG
jgi:hypothetical protein